MKLNHNFVLMKIFLLSAYSLLNFVATPLYILVLPINKLLQKNTNKTDFVNYFSTLVDDVWFTLYFCVVADFTVLYTMQGQFTQWLYMCRFICHFIGYSGIHVQGNEGWGRGD